MTARLDWRIREDKVTLRHDMRGFVATILVISAVSLALGGMKRDVLTAATDDQPVLNAEHALQLALAKTDKKAVGLRLDDQFSWTTEDGRTQTKPQFLRLITTNASSTECSEIKTRSYGQIAVVTGSGALCGDPHVFFVRFWVKRPAGWRLFAYQATKVLSKTDFSQQAPPAGNDGIEALGCENPCRSVPFVAKTAAQLEVVKAYQGVETAVTVHDASSWAYHVADEFVGIGQKYAGKPDTKEERIMQIKRASTSVILPRMLSLRVFVFGNVAIMIADHQSSGAAPFHVIRAWVKRDGRWQLFHRQETTIEQ
jgi:hypothetical protein